MYGKANYIAIDVNGPTLNNHTPTTIGLSDVNFCGCTKDTALLPLVEELRPLIKDNVPLVPQQGVFQEETGFLLANYAVTVSFVLFFRRSSKYAYERPATIVVKTLLLLILFGIANIACAWLVAIPFDNYTMSKNLVQVGCAKPLAVAVYLLTTLPVYILWAR